MAFVAIKMGRRQGTRSGAYLNRYVTDEQRSRRPIFIATLRAVVSWLFFGVAHSLRINSDMLVARALKNSQLTDGESHVIYGTGHQNQSLPGRAAKDTIDVRWPRLADGLANAFCLPRHRRDRRERRCRARVQRPTFYQSRT
jgi:hypothetical protein